MTETAETTETAIVSKGSSEELNRSFEIVRKATYFVGIDPFDPKRDINFRFIGSVLFFCMIYVLCFYSGWILRDNWYRVLESWPVLALTIQGTNKIWIGFVHKVRYCNLFQTTGEIYASFDGDERNQPILRDTVNKMVMLLKAMLAVYTLCGVLLLIAIALLLIITGEKFMALSIYVPWVDPTTDSGYALTSFVHMALISYAIIGYLASDTAFIATVVPIIAYANSLKNEIDNFNLLLEVPKRNEQLIADKLIRVSKLHQMIVRFEQDAIEHFKEGCLVQIAMQAGTVLLCIFLIYICRYAQALSVLLAILFELTQYCALGTIVTAKNDQMLIDIYTIGWHSLKKPQQKIVAFMLHRAQNAKDLTIGGMAPLNMITYVQIMKTMYSFLTMLITMLD